MSRIFFACTADGGNSGREISVLRARLIAANKNVRKENAKMS